MVFVDCGIERRALLHLEVRLIAKLCERKRMILFVCQVVLWIRGVLNQVCRLTLLLVAILQLYTAQHQTSLWLADNFQFQSSQWLQHVK